MALNTHSDMTKGIPFNVRNRLTRTIGRSISLLCALVLVSSDAAAQQTEPDPFAQVGWSLAAVSYATGAACARKRFAFSSGDVETLKQIAIKKAKGLDPEKVNEGWERIVTGLQFAPPTAAQCFDAYEKANFTDSTSPFGF